jgi:hypothetical protein
MLQNFKFFVSSGKTRAYEENKNILNAAQTQHPFILLLPFEWNFALLKWFRKNILKYFISKI